ncbi:MAG: MBL fold metallo-hydrolase [Colwellia sp.]|nr:MBL fold metallo-hydrolase [Colwellia sp.]
MKYIIIAISLLFLTSCGTTSSLDLSGYAQIQEPRLYPALYTKKWRHGVLDCELSKDPSLEVYRYDTGSYIIRQNKCANFEAPFIYVLFGEKKVVILDTGASKSPVENPLYLTVTSLIEQELKLMGKNQFEILVIHSHSHSDHYQGDSQFRGKNNVTIVAPTHKAMKQFFTFDDWPNTSTTLDLGNRKLVVIPTPGHQEEAISIYDPKTKWLLTGDTFYPGYIYVKNWSDYRKSIARLVAFTKYNEVSAILGAHIEMKTESGEYYPIGTTFQPDEASLALSLAQLNFLNNKLNEYQAPQKIIMDKLIIAPMSTLNKMINHIVKWFI